MEITEQLNNAMEFIEAHIEEDSLADRVSEATSYSAYHFGRLFYYVADLPLTEYIRKRRLSLAAEELLSGTAKVIDLAVKYGYDSADSFTRAFVRTFGVTPSAARRAGKPLPVFPKLNFQIQIKGEA